MSIYSTRPITLTNLQTYPLSSRKSKVSVRDFAKPPAANPALSKFLSSLPNFLASADLRNLLAAIQQAGNQRTLRNHQRPGHCLHTPRPRPRASPYRHRHSPHAHHRRRRRSRLRHPSRLSSLLLPRGTNAPRRHLSKLGLCRSAPRGFPESRVRRAQPWRSSSPHHHRQLRLYSALSSVAECSKAPHSSRPPPTGRTFAPLCHHRPSRTAPAS